MTTSGPTEITPAARDVSARVTHLFEHEFAAEVVDWEQSGETPASVFERLAATGVFAARWPRGDVFKGDLRLGAHLVRHCALLSPGLGIAVIPHLDGVLPLLHTCAAGPALERRAHAGELIGCVAISEATSASDVTNCATRAVQSGRDWRLTGHKQYVSNFRTATDCLVFARTGAGSPLTAFTLFLVPTRATGITSRPHELLGCRPSGTCEVQFDGVHVADERRVGSVGGAFPRILRFLRLERMWNALGAAAIAELCLEIATSFCERRVIAGQPLRSHQAVAHRLVDMSVKVQTARLVVDDLLAAAEIQLPSTEACARAKLWAARVAWEVADEALQFLGGAGYTQATALERVWRDIRLIRVAGGADEVLREIISRHLGAGPLHDHPDLARVRAAARSQAELVNGTEQTA